MSKPSSPSPRTGERQQRRSKHFTLTAFALCSALALAGAGHVVHAAATGAAPVVNQRAAAYWQDLSLSADASAARAGVAAKTPALSLRRLRTATLDLGAIAAVAKGAPEARNTTAGASPLIISLPHPDGGYQRFTLVEAPIMEPGLAALHPEIKTYKGQGIDDPRATLRMDITQLGLHASVRGPNGGWYVDPYYERDTSVYASYTRADLINRHGPLIEGTSTEAQLSVAKSFYKEGDAVEVRASGFAAGAAVQITVRAEADGAELQSVRATADRKGEISLTLPAAASAVGGYEVSASDGRTSSSASFQVLDAELTPAAAVGSSLRTYRLALVTDPSYASYFGAENVTAAKVTLINRVSQVYEDETSIALVLIAGTDALNLNTAADMTGANGPCGGAACFTTAQAASCGSGTLTRNRVVTGLLAGASNFDVGHIAFGLNGGGIASLGVVGGNNKAQGCTGIPTPVGDYFAVDYVAHELGHQFSGNHTFNGVTSNCSGGNRNTTTSVETGSGSSVMAYAGICGTDNLQTHSDPYWSQRSFDEIVAYTSGAESNLNEVQMGVLTGFATNGQQFRLSYNGNLSAPIIRGTNFTVAGVKAAIEGIAGWPTGGTVTISTLGDTAFTITFGGTLASTNVPLLALTDCTSGCTGYVGEITAGGPTTKRGAVSSTTNTAPVVSAPTRFTIPVRTPFALTGSAVDAEGDALTYLWEQNDRGGSTGTALTNNTKVNGPLFRQFGTRAIVTNSGTLEYGSPGQNHTTDNPTRVFPDMLQILANNTNALSGACPTASATPTAAEIECFSEFLPTAAYVGVAGVNASPASLNFKLTVRDGQGGVNSATTQLVLAAAAGPFLVTSHNSAATFDAGSTQAITWNVANTNAAPVSTANVKITLSADGGATWPYVLAASVPNNGSANVVLPAVETTQARIKVEAIGNVFFDVSDANFAVTIPPVVPEPVPGDVNGDGVVNCLDYAIVKASLNKRVDQAGYDARADVNGDGVINAADLLYVQARLTSGTRCS